MKKTPEEILNALNCWDTELTCEKCAYVFDTCDEDVKKDAAELIRELQDRNRAQRAELLANGKEPSFPDIVKKFQEYEAEPAAKEAQGKPKSLMGNVRRVRAILPRKERLAQLAEECAELGQAALKYRRVLDGTNPTPVGETEAFGNLYEEAEDVIGCLVALGMADVDARIGDYVDPAKFERWVGRLEARGDA